MPELFGNVGFVFAIRDWRSFFSCWANHGGKAYRMSHLGAT
jgi:hypothetical protein